MENLIKMSEALENLVQENDLVGELQGIEKEHDIRPSAELKKVLNEKIEQERMILEKNMKIYKERVKSLIEAQLKLADDLDKIEL